MMRFDKPETSLEEITLSSKIVHEGRIFTLKVDRIRLPDGRESTRDVIVHPGAVCILPLTENKEVILERQFRYPVGAVLLEAPAGTMHPGEPPLDTAKRELLEETGYEAKTWKELGSAWSAAGFCSERMYYYLATDLVEKEMNLDKDEFLEVVKVPLAECQRLAREGIIQDNKTLVLLYFLREKWGW